VIITKSYNLLLAHDQTKQQIPIVILK